MYETLKKQTAVSTLFLLGLAACSNDAEVTTAMATEPEKTELAANLETAEGMIDAFYSFVRG